MLEGHERIAFDASTRINRSDFGVNWTDFVGANTTIGDEVKIATCDRGGAYNIVGTAAAVPLRDQSDGPCEVEWAQHLEVVSH